MKKNHVFLFQIHKDSALVRRILNRLAADNHYFAINVDGKSAEKKELLMLAKTTPNVVMLTERIINHGGYSFTNCIIEQMRFCYELDISFDYYHTCSGQDYPCVSNAVFDSFFMGSSVSYTMMDMPEQVEKWRGTKYKKRLDRYNFTDQIHGKVAERIHLNGVLSLLLSPFRRAYSRMEEIWGGWNWFSLSEECIIYLLQFFRDNPDYLRRFKYTTAADELVFSSVLYYERKNLNVEIQNSLRFIEWHPRRSYNGRLPLLLDEREYEEIVDSGALFCRKVESEYSKRLLKMIDERIDNMLDSYMPVQNPKYP